MKTSIFLIFITSFFTTNIFGQEYYCYSNDKLPVLFYIKKVNENNTITIVNNLESYSHLSEDLQADLENDKRIDLATYLKDLDTYVHKEVSAIFDMDTEYPLIKKRVEKLEYEFKNKDVLTHNIEYLENNFINGTIKSKSYGEEFVPEYSKSDEVIEHYSFDSEEIRCDINNVLFYVFTANRWEKSYKVLEKVKLNFKNGTNNLVLYKKDDEKIQYNNQLISTTNIRLLELYDFNEEKEIPENIFNEKINPIIDFYLDSSFKIIRIIIRDFSNSYILNLNDEETECKKELFEMLNIQKY